MDDDDDEMPAAPFFSDQEILDELSELLDRLTASVDQTALAKPLKSALVSWCSAYGAESLPGPVFSPPPPPPELCPICYMAHHPHCPEPIKDIEQNAISLGYQPFAQVTGALSALAGDDRLKNPAIVQVFLSALHYLSVLQNDVGKIREHDKALTETIARISLRGQAMEAQLQQLLSDARGATPPQPDSRTVGRIKLDDSPDYE